MPEVSLVTNDRDKNIATFIKNMYYLCKMVGEEEADEGTAFKSIYLASELEEFTPDAKLLDYILDIDYLQSIDEFASIYGDVASMIKCKDERWPIPHDNTPNNVFDWGKYDINLTFGGQQ